MGCGEEEWLLVCREEIKLKVYTYSHKREREREREMLIKEI